MSKTFIVPVEVTEVYYIEVDLDDEELEDCEGDEVCECEVSGDRVEDNWADYSRQTAGEIPLERDVEVLFEKIEAKS